MKFYTTQEYATNHNVDESTVKKWALEKKVKSYNIHHRLSNLIIDQDNKETTIIGLMNLKGGAGKTTLAAHFASLLSKVGFKVLLVDTDHQNQCKLFFPEQNYEYAINDILNNEVDVNNGIYKVSTHDSNLDIIYSSYALALFARNYKSLDGFYEMINKIKSNYEFIIVDTSPNFDIINHNVANTVTNIIIPVIPTNMHVEGIGHQIEALQNIAKIPLDRILGILPNAVNEKTIEHPTYIQFLENEYPEGVYENRIPFDPWLEKVTTYKTNIFDYREKSKSSQSLKKAVWETLRRL
ncbi:MAG: ParA family protein [Spirochaetota bacterium]|nr:ParA family protein [Spirochaetota bacterium]